MSQRAILITAVAVIIILAGGWWVLSEQGQGSQVSMVPAKEIVVDGSEFKFEPGSISLKKGEKVKLTLKNTGKFPHNLVISDLSVSTRTIQAGESDTIEFTPDKDGNFPFICTIDEHAAKGMKGSATIQP